jgi:hypothetical protein
MLEGEALGEGTFAPWGPSVRVALQPPVYDRADGREIRRGHDFLYPAEIIHQSSPRLGEIACP